MLNDSILTSVKKSLGIVEEDTSFDDILLMDINAVIAILQQLNVRGGEPYFVASKEETWKDYLQDNKSLNDVRAFMYLKVRLLFDPPASSAAIQSATNLLSELEWRILMTADKVNT